MSDRVGQSQASIVGISCSPLSPSPFTYLLPSANQPETSATAGSGIPHMRFTRLCPPHVSATTAFVPLSLLAAERWQRGAHKRWPRRFSSSSSFSSLQRIRRSPPRLLPPSFTRTYVVAATAATATERSRGKRALQRRQQCRWPLSSAETALSRRWSSSARRSCMQGTPPMWCQWGRRLGKGGSCERRETLVVQPPLAGPSPYEASNSPAHRPQPRRYLTLPPVPEHGSTRTCLQTTRMWRGCGSWRQ